MLPPPMLTHRGGGFPLKCSNEHSINRLTPYVPRFFFIFVGYAIMDSP